MGDLLVRGQIIAAAQTQAILTIPGIVAVKNGQIMARVATAMPAVPVVHGSMPANVELDAAARAAAARVAAPVAVANLNGAMQLTDAQPGAGSSVLMIPWFLVLAAVALLVVFALVHYRKSSPVSDDVEDASIENEE